MHDNIYTFVCDELEELDKKAKNGKLSMTEMQYADLLAHYKKSALTNDAMEESGYSGYYPMMGNSRSDGMGGWNDNSYARGRGRNAGRDSMGRYSSDGYSRNYSRDGGLSEELRGLMQDAPNEQIRSEIQRLVEKIDRM